MAIRKIRYNNDELLRKKCREVKVIDEKINQILDDMMDTLHHTENGAALAANQVGILKRLVVIDYENNYLKLVNPKIVGSSGVQECVEVCLSFPDRFVKTIRPQKVTVQAFNEKGEEVLITGENEMAKCFCHEIEHLDGAIFLDKAIEEYEN
jgi:peptide deformylase